MIFESLLPLLFLAAVPVIIILYLLRPRGRDYLISSNLLWQKLLKNEQAKTFFEKFVNNILMYLQILITVLLIVALMSPFINMNSKTQGRSILLIDTSGSMQHTDVSGKSRLEEAKEQAIDYVRSAESMRCCIMTVDETGVKMLAVDITDTDSLIQTLRGITCSDSGGSLTLAQESIDMLMGDSEENAANLVVFTDGNGAEDFDGLRAAAGKELHVVGSAVYNVANDYTVFSSREDGLYDVVVSVSNYGDEGVSFDVGLYDEDDKLIALTNMSLNPMESKTCLFEGTEWKGQTLTSRIDGISFSKNESGGQPDNVSDSLLQDNVSRAIKGRENNINGLLVGNGNTFIEKAYTAVTGQSISKSENDTVAGYEVNDVTGALGKDDAYNVVIYDAGQTPKAEGYNRLVFGSMGGDYIEELENIVLDMTDCDLTASLSGFTIGVNTAYCFELPEGAVSFLEYDGKCVGYYRETGNHKEIVVGFDIRESDFPLRAEFPIFLANAMLYLSDTSWLATNVYYAGEEIALQPWAEIDRSSFEKRPAKAGLYQLGNDEYQESYVVRFCTSTESDGRKTAESVLDLAGMQLNKVKRTLRNVFLLLALILLLVEWIIYVRKMRYHGKFYLVVRGVVAICVILAILGISIRIGSGQTATVFVVDISNSNEEHLAETEKYLHDTVDKMPNGNVYGIVTFGKNTLVEQFLTSEKSYMGLMSVPEKTATNFEDALSKALTLIPGDYKKRLVVITDGKETRGDIDNMASALSTGQVELLTLLYEDEVGDDAYIDDVTLPSYLHPGDKYSITVMVASNYDTDAVIALYNGSSLIEENSVHLNKGSNRFVFNKQVASDAGAGSMENLRIQVKAPGDTCEENDFYSAYSVVEAPPRILVISGLNADISGFSSILNAAGCDYNMVSAINAPYTLEQMLEYKSIILADTYIDDLPDGFIDNLETYVKDYGCGFICCGGEDSFALGGYRDTVIETVLPVDMQLKGVNEMPSMAMIMVIDHSGSMLVGDAYSSASNLDLAIRAASVAVDNLRDEDYVGVLVFDDVYDWQVGLTKADDKTAIKDSIKSISEGGGTTIKPALKEAFKAMAECDASIKHVVLLTDGMGETNDFSDVIHSYSNSGITLSTVAVGAYSDTELLEDLADECGGRYYYADISSDIPKIFAQEVFLGGDSYIQNGEFSLSVLGNHELTENLFADGWPLIYGYISASPKTASNVVIASEQKGDPILTVWQYGLGRTAAWNCDVSGEWSGAFAGEEDYVQLWKRIVDYSTGNASISEDSVDVVTAGEYTEVVYRAQEYDADIEIYVTLIEPNGDTREEKLHATAPGKYEAELFTPQTGLYHFNIRRTSGGDIQNYVTTAAAVQFSDEYKFDVSTAAYLNFMDKYGRLITKEDAIWSHIKATAGEKYSLANILIALAICLFIVDIALRRFQYAPKIPAFITARALRRSGQNENAADMAGLSSIQPTENTMEAVMSDRQEKGRTAQQSYRKKQKPTQAEPSLDTSSLLKKKDDRNL
ncbi:MAG: VWA domain-containing protein [Clostridiales bacterium]|nr:VWA domain-containing protein [Clostridiales bacterium]